MSARTWRGLFVRLWEHWKAIAHVIGNFQARVLFSLLYFILIPPFALIAWVLTDPLEIRSRPHPCWLALVQRRPGLTEARRQS